MAYLETFLLVLLVGFLLYKWATAKYGVWKERGIPHKKPLPLIGTVKWRSLVGKTSFLQETIDSYMEFKDSKVYGIYSFRDPGLMLRDLEIIKKIGIKDFEFFPNHRKMFDMGDSIFSKTLFVLRDRRWKEMRNTLSPSFTGNKMRMMFQLINECSMEAVKYVEEEVKVTDTNELEMEMKDYFTRYTNDVIASTAFGIKVNSFKDKTNEFYTIGSKFIQLQKWLIVKLLFFTSIPKIMKTLGVELFDKKQTDYFTELVTDTMRYRKEHNIIRPDMIHLLMEAKSNFDQENSELTGKHEQLNDDDLVAQCFLFFVAGFETVSVCLCFMLYELMMNPDIQQRLYEEVDEIDRELNGKPLDYDTLMKMKYMDMVLSESLRKWPPAFTMDRECAADYKLTDGDDNFLVDLKKGDLIFIPTIGLHYDPEHFENPTKFNPERFSDENKHRIKPMSYLPFGVGPRICIANRLALMEAKSIIYHFLLKFEVRPAEKTVKDLMKSLKGFQMLPAEKFWMKFVPRVNK